MTARLLADHWVDLVVDGRGTTVRDAAGGPSC